MRPSILLLPLLVALAACGGEADRDNPGSAASATPQAEATATVGISRGETRDPQEVLLRSSRNSADVESFHGTFELAMDFGGFDMSFGGDMAFRAPDTMHMTMSMFGQDLEMLVYGSQFYIDMGSGWRSVDLSGAGINLDQLSELWENRGLFDVEEMAEAFGDDVEKLSDEIINGKTVEHYHVNADPEDVFSTLSEGFIDPAMLEQVGSVLESMEADFYIDPATDLLRRAVVTIGMDAPQGGQGEVSMTMDMLEYNGDVDIPAEPVDAPPLDPSELGGET